MKILEQFLCGKKGNPELCEDTLIIVPQLVVVVDGVTAKGKKTWNGMSSGRYAGKCLEKALRKENLYQMDGIELFTYLDGCLNREEGNAPLAIKDYPRASVIVYNDYFKEIWAYGDCQCLINGVRHLHTKRVDTLTSSVRSFYLEYAISQGAEEKSFYSEDPGRKAIAPLLEMQFAFENKMGSWGYPVLNGQGICPEMMVSYKLQPGDELVLASDGYPRLMETLEKSERALEEELKKDPLCYRSNPSTKGIMEGALSFDDRCYCRIQV